MNVRFCLRERLWAFLSYLFYFFLLFFLLWCWKPAAAQIRPEIKPLKIGDRVPDIALNGVIHHTRPGVSLGDFKGKLLILDFWATWCSPCVSMIPRMDSLQAKFKDKVVFLPVSSQSEKTIAAFRAKYDLRMGKRIQGIEVVGDTVLKKLFYHNALPHYVWIDPAGVVSAVTETRQINEENISAFLSRKPVSMTQKADVKRIPYSDSLPMLAGNNGGKGQNIIYHSLLTGYTEGVQGLISMKSIEGVGRKISLTNSPKIWLYKIAYAPAGTFFDQKNIVIETKDSACLDSELYGQQYDDWMRQGNGFCYELIVPVQYAEKAHTMMQSDIERYFPQYKAGVQKRMVPVLVLLRKDQKTLEVSSDQDPYMESDKLELRARNVSLTQIVSRLNRLESLSLEIRDETGYQQGVDMDIRVGLKNAEELSKELEKYGFTLQRALRETSMLVISDARPLSKQ